MKIFSGMRPTGQLHIGNYLGALRNWVELQKKADCIFGIVDYHAITTSFNSKTIKKDSINLALDYLGAGIDPKKSIIMIQSHIPEHTELAWILETLTSMGDLQRMTQFKEKSKQHQENAGLFSYPVLMAADILLYKADAVPVGEDQKQHVELTRKLAKKFNNQFGKTFSLPQTLLVKNGARIMSLTDPKKKMSKTGDESINLNDSPNEIRRKIKKAVTDSGKEIKYSKSKPAISNLLTIYHLFSNKSIKELENKYKNKGYGEFKKDLAEVIIKELKPFQEKRKKYSPELVEKILNQGAEKAQKIAQKTIKEVKTKIGLI